MKPKAVVIEERPEMGSTRVLGSGRGVGGALQRELHQTNNQMALIE
jgi:hypothetical protein